MKHRRVEDASRIRSMDVSLMRSQALSVNSECPNSDVFWDSVSANMKAERMKLVFVADDIPASLRSLIEFLDRAMPNIECYGIEISRYVSNGIVLLSKRVIQGDIKPIRKPSTKIDRWDRERFLKFMEEKSGTEVVKAASDILDYCCSIGLSVKFGTGNVNVSVSAFLNNISVLTISVSKKGKIVLYISLPRATNAIGGRLSADEVLKTVQDVFTTVPEAVWQPSDKYVEVDISALADSKLLNEMENALKQIYG